MHSLPPWLRKITAVSLLAGLVALVVFFGVRPTIESHLSLQDNLAHSQDLIDRLSRTGERRESLLRRIDALESSMRDSGALLLSETEPLAAAELREAVKRLIDQTGGELQSSQNLAASDVEGFKKVAIRVGLKTNVHQLKPLLYGLEAQRPYLFVEALEIKARKSRRKEAADSGATEAPALLARLDIYGYILPGAEP